MSVTKGAIYCAENRAQQHHPLAQICTDAPKESFI